MTATAPLRTPRATTVPLPGNRWQPERAGVVNVWQYGEETLQFENGRLLLYGANGSGKTMLLELLLPYLLDAKGQPGRLSTSGADRGGLWDRVTGYDTDIGRTGYLWATFVRTGTDQRLTIGTRLRANPGGGGSHHWFTTTLRPGVDLALVDDFGKPLDVAVLKDAIGETGQVWGNDTAGYREAVRSTLYRGFTPVQMDAMISALLVVRKQSVTDGLSAAKLDELLSDGLSAPDDEEIAKLAKGFQDLDRRRNAIDALKDLVAAAGTISTEARRYAQSVLAELADARVSAETSKDDVRRKQRTAQVTLDKQVERRAKLLSAKQATDALKQQLAKTLEGLRESDAYKHAGELAERTDHVNELKARVESAARAAEKAVARATKKAGHADRDAGDAARAAEQLTAAIAELNEAIDAAGLRTDVDRDDLDATAEHLRVEVSGVRDAIAAVRTALSAHQAAVQARNESQDRVDLADEVRGNRVADLGKADTELTEAVEQWRAQVQDWAAGLEHLDRETIIAGLHVDVAPADVHRVAEQAYATLAEQIAGQRQQTETAREEAAGQIDEIDVELRRLDDGGITAPQPPDGRRDRIGLPGLPLWQAVDFRDHVADKDAAAVESALASLGILDAWVRPDGTVDLEGVDTELRAALQHSPANGRDLREVIHADAAAPVDTAVLDGVLAQIGFGTDAAPVAVAADATYRAGPLHGRAVAGDHPRFIGAAARERHRLARIAELTSQREDLQAAVDAAARHLQQLGRQRDVAAAERDASRVAAEGRLAGAHDDRTRAEAAVEGAEEALRLAHEELDERDTRVRHTQTQLMRTATARGLPTHEAALDAREKVCGTVLERTQTVRTRADRAALRAENAQRSAEDAEDAAGHAKEAREAADVAAEQHAGAAAKLQAMLDAVGDDAARVQQRITEAKHQLTGTEGRLTGIGEQLTGVAGEIGAAEGKLQTANDKYQEAEQRRDEEHDRLAAAFADGLLDDANLDDVDADVPNVTASLTAAQTIRQQLADQRLRESPKALEQLNAVVYGSQRSLVGRFELVVATSDAGTWSTATATAADGRVLHAADVHAELAAELDAARAELSAQDEEVFKTVYGEAFRSHLAERMRAATATVGQMNDLLDRVRTAAGGVRVQLRWTVHGGDIAPTQELRKVKELLLGSRHTDAERQLLKNFLVGQVEKLRASEGDTGSWPDRLAAVLDYRRWHTFEILVHHDRFGDRPVGLGSRKVTLSAGEKTVVMTGALLAAIAAHYMPRGRDEDAPDCPRLLLMDELFPKLDPTNKRQLMGLISDLGLDVVFTSDKDWCAYDTLDAIAIHFVTKAGDASLTTRMVWNGSNRIPAPVDREDADLVLDVASADS